MTDQQTAAPDNALIEVERDAEGHVLMCTGCGTVETIRSIKARKPKAFSCCPERKMVRPATEDDDADDDRRDKRKGHALAVKALHSLNPASKEANDG